MNFFIPRIIKGLEKGLYGIDCETCHIIVIKMMIITISIC